MEKKTVGDAAKKLQTRKTLPELKKGVADLQAQLTPLTGGMTVQNEEIEFSSDGDHEVGFELTREISASYAQEIKVRVANGEIQVYAQTQYFNDGRGNMSQSWAPAFDEGDDLVDSKGDSITLVMAAAMSRLIGQHTELLMRCGVCAVDAAVIAKKFARLESQQDVSLIA